MTPLQSLEHQLKLTNYAFCLHGKKPFSMDNIRLTEMYIKEIQDLKKGILKLNRDFDFSNIKEE